MALRSPFPPPCSDPSSYPQSGPQLGSQSDFQSGSQSGTPDPQALTGQVMFWVKASGSSSDSLTHLGTSLGPCHVALGVPQLYSGSNKVTLKLPWGQFLFSGPKLAPELVPEPILAPELPGVISCTFLGSSECPPGGPRPHP